jgi:HEAT repeat protein
MLGIAGDRSYAPAVAKLLDKKDPPVDLGKFQPPISSRGRAAMVLSLMGAREYVPRFVVMLKSSNHYDRSGAVMALGKLRAKDHAKDVASLLNRKEPQVGDDDGPIYALMEMGLGAEYSGEFARLLDKEFPGEIGNTAAYALAKLGAKESAVHIAKLLNKPYQRGHGAKALAIMGATQYADKIAGLLKSEDALERKDALLALGVMRATKYLSQVAKHLKDPEQYIHLYAAYALVLMEADTYASEVLPQVQHMYEQNLYLTDVFGPLVEDEVIEIGKRFNESFLKMKGRLAK